MSADSAFIIERTINAPVARVWQALTNKNDLKQWLPFMEEFEPVVGHEIRFKLGKDPKHQYLHISRVIQVVEGRKLVYGWRYDGFAGDSHVSFELEPAGNSTKLKLSYSIIEPFPADNPDFAEANFREGWTFTAEGLKQYVEKVNAKEES